MSRRTGAPPPLWLGEPTARDLMAEEPLTVRPTDPARYVAQVMAEHGCGMVPVVDELGRLLGVITDRDVVSRLVARGVDLSTATVGDAMSDRALAVNEGDGLRLVLRRMGEYRVRRAPVVTESGRVVGVVSLSDLVAVAGIGSELCEIIARVFGRSPRRAR